MVKMIVFFYFNEQHTRTTIISPTNSYRQKNSIKLFYDIAKLRTVEDHSVTTTNGTHAWSVIFSLTKMYIKKIKTYISNFSLHDEFLEQPSSGSPLSKDSSGETNNLKVLW